MKRIISLFAALAVALSALAFSAPASPAAAAFSCPAGMQSVGTGNVYALIYESGGFGGPSQPDGNILCLRAPTTGVLNVPDLKAVPYNGDDGVCDGQLATSYGTWNDCTSSLKVSIDCHHKVSFYGSANYGTLLYSFSVSGQVSSMPIGRNDSISSIKITYSSVCQSSTGT